PVRSYGYTCTSILCDSGAGGSSIRKPWAEKMGLAFGGQLLTKGAAGSGEVAIAKGVRFDLPGLEVSADSVGIMDLSPVSAMLGHRLEGLLGYDVLSRVVVRVDYAHQKVAMYEPSSFVVPGSAAVVPLTFLSNWPMVSVKILLPGGESIATKAFIDSGASGLSLSTPFTNDHHIVNAVRKTISSS